MHRTYRTLGFSIVEVVVIVVAVGIIGLLGYSLYNNVNSHNKSNQSASVQASQSSDVPAAPAAINTTSDLDKATAVLDQTTASNGTSNDSSLLDSQLTNF